ncbi:unnamed protein product [Protopolystoma xenopodis]|uniref:Uncharacterized protein n=1 Tax=Protopolystoma xenopodis TaxID=117903 RepID=A0A448WW45_9PLAT|nr:unnamed protein product [Protopolystoma xenopodis]
MASEVSSLAYLSSEWAPWGPCGLVEPEKVSVLRSEQAAFGSTGRAHTVCQQTRWRSCADAAMLQLDPATGAGSVQGLAPSAAVVPSSFASSQFDQGSPRLEGSRPVLAIQSAALICPEPLFQTRNCALAHCEDNMLK